MTRDFSKSAKQPKEIVLTVHNSVSDYYFPLLRDGNLRNSANRKEISDFPFRTEKDEYILEVVHKHIKEIYRKVTVSFDVQLKSPDFLLDGRHTSTSE